MSDLAVDAMMAMLERYGGVWSGDRDWLRGQVASIIDDARELADDYPEGDDAAEARLRLRLTEDDPTV